MWREKGGTFNKPYLPKNDVHILCVCVCVCVSTCRCTYVISVSINNYYTCTYMYTCVCKQHEYDINNVHTLFLQANAASVGRP